MFSFTYQGITFTAITIRVTIRVSGVTSSTTSGHITSGGRVRGGERFNQVSTRGTIPMHPIAINVTKDIENHREESLSTIDKPHTFMDTDQSV